MELVNDVFTLPEQNLSLPDIALIYTANDFRVINKNNHFDGSKQLNKSLRDCLQDFHTHTIDSKKTQNLEIGSIKYVIDYSNKDMEPSPCLNLKKFPKCSHYCTLHKQFFEKTPLREFIMLMKYAIPQRKIRYISVKYAKNNEYIVISKINISLLNLAWNNLLQKKFYLRGLWGKRA